LPRCNVDGTIVGRDSDVDSGTWSCGAAGRAAPATATKVALAQCRYPGALGHRRVGLPCPDEDQPGAQSLDVLRYGLAANARWKALDVYGAMIWDRVYNLPGQLKNEFDRTAAGLSVQVDYLALDSVMLSNRFD
jgi:hypothetical protein